MGLGGSAQRDRFFFVFLVGRFLLVELVEELVERFFLLLGFNFLRGDGLYLDRYARFDGESRFYPRRYKFVAADPAVGMARSRSPFSFSYSSGVCTLSNWLSVAVNDVASRLIGPTGARKGPCPSAGSPPHSKEIYVPPLGIEKNAGLVLRLIDKNEVGFDRPCHDFFFACACRICTYC